MQAIDLAIYADGLAAEGAALAARLERARGRLRLTGIEREARHALRAETVARLQALGLLRATGEQRERIEIAELTGALEALAALQAWVEHQLFVARASASLEEEVESGLHGWGGEPGAFSEQGGLGALEGAEGGPPEIDCSRALEEEEEEEDAMTG